MCDGEQYKSVKTSRGPLQKGWQKKVAPIMTCYKAVRINFEYWGVQGKVRVAVVARCLRSLSVSIETHTVCIAG